MKKYIDDNYLRFQDELYSLLRIPSISPVSGYESEVFRCACAFAEMMNQTGIQTRIFNTSGNPIVYGETKQQPDKPTILIYGHYDVQPEGDKNLWISAPYEPEIRNGRIYARGVGDNKGQIFSHIKGYETYVATKGTPGINLKYIIEGEEEVGSPNLSIFAKEQKDLLKADVTIWSDANIHPTGRPIILLGLKGLTSIKITVKGPCRDIHSQFSSVLPNPVWKLTHILSSLKDNKGNVTVPGFYDNAQTPDLEELNVIKKIPGMLSDYMDDWNVSSLLHDVDMQQFYLRYMYEPTLNCGCIAAGNPQAAKNIVPSEATAWLDVRTVPGQDSKKIYELIRDFIYSLCIPGVEVTGSNLDAAYTSINNPYVDPAINVLRRVWEQEPILYPALGGSGPFYVFNTIIGAPCIMIPYADTEQHDHGPNESIPVELIKKGILTSAVLIEEFETIRPQ